MRLVKPIALGGYATLGVVAGVVGAIEPPILAEVFEQFPELLAVAIIRDEQIQLPRGSARLEGGDQLLIAASETRNFEAFKDLVRSVG